MAEIANVQRALLFASLYEKVVINNHIAAKALIQLGKVFLQKICNKLANAIIAPETTTFVVMLSDIDNHDGDKAINKPARKVSALANLDRSRLFIRNIPPF